VKYLIIVRELGQTFTTYKYDLVNGRVKFEDKFGNKKDFPDKSCFIEEVRE
jgi:hypothetical protein